MKMSPHIPDDVCNDRQNRYDQCGKSNPKCATHQLSITPCLSTVSLTTFKFHRRREVHVWHVQERVEKARFPTVLRDDCAQVMGAIILEIRPVPHLLVACDAVRFLYDLIHIDAALQLLTFLGRQHKSLLAVTFAHPPLQEMAVPAAFLRDVRRFNVHAVILPETEGETSMAKSTPVPTGTGAEEVAG